jgi:hypothetical protein
MSSNPIITSPLRFNDQEEPDHWFKQFTEKNAEGLRAQGASIIDFNVCYL